MTVFVRAERGEGRRPVELSRTSTFDISASTEVASSEKGELAPLGIAVMRDDAMRAEIAATTKTPSAARFQSLQKFSWVLAISFFWLLSRDLGDSEHRFQGVVRAAFDILFAVALLREATRALPHRRFVVAALTLGAAARVAVALSESCRATPIPAALFGASVALLALWLARVPTPQLVAREVFDALNVSIDEVLALPEDPAPSAKVVTFSIAASVALAYVVHAYGGAENWLLMATIAVLSLFLPWIATRAVHDKPDWRRPIDARLIWIGVLGFVAAASLASAVHDFFDAGAYLARCRDPASFARSGVHAELVREAIEAKRVFVSARASLPSILVATIFTPVASELVFRGLLQRALGRRFGGAFGLFASAALFAVACAGTQETFAYEAFAAGLAFGVVYAEGGIMAAVIAHVLYSVHLIV